MTPTDQPTDSKFDRAAPREHAPRRDQPSAGRIVLVSFLDEDAEGKPVRKTRPAVIRVVTDIEATTKIKSRGAPLRIPACQHVDVTLFDDGGARPLNGVFHVDGQLEGAPPEAPTWDWPKRS